MELKVLVGMRERVKLGFRLPEARPIPFLDRRDAGRRLAAALAAYRGRDVVVLALPRGGVPVAHEVALALKAPLDLVLVRKIGTPGYEELAMGAVADGGEPVTVRNEDVIASLGVSESAFETVRRRELSEIERRREVYLGGRPRPEVAGRIAIVVDDGVATGATMCAALRSVRARGPEKLVLATPVAPAGLLARLSREADEVVCLEDLGPVGAVGGCYLNFGQLSDDAVTAILAKSSNPR